MPTELPKYVPDFSEKFKLAKLALVRMGEPIAKQMSYASLVFFDSNDNAALSQLSSCITGKRQFPAERLETLLSNFDRRGLLKGLTTTIWLGSLAEFKATLASLGLVEERGSAHDRLSETLAGVERNEDALALLDNYAHTFETSNDFELSLQLLSADNKRKIAALFCQIIEGSWGADGRRLQSAMVAGAVLARMWPSLTHLPEVSRLNNWLETRVEDLPLHLAPLTDAVCYISTRSGRHGAFRKNIERTIQDPLWRGRDYARQLQYHRGYKTLVLHVRYHLISRRAHPEILCNDVGRVISIYPRLGKHGASVDLSEYLKEQTIKSLEYADIKRSVRERVEDIIEQRSS